MWGEKNLRMNPKFQSMMLKPVCGCFSFTSLTFSSLTLHTHYIEIFCRHHKLSCFGILYLLIFKCKPYSGLQTQMPKSLKDNLQDGYPRGTPNWLIQNGGTQFLPCSLLGKGASSHWVNEIRNLKSSLDSFFISKQEPASLSFPSVSRVSSSFPVAMLCFTFLSQTEKAVTPF